MRDFPIHADSIKRLPLLPRFIPWDHLRLHANAAHTNHGQSLERLAERGGLTWMELRNIVENKRWDGRTYSRVDDPRQIAEDAEAAVAVLGHVGKL